MKILHNISTSFHIGIKSSCTQSLMIIILLALGRCAPAARSIVSTPLQLGHCDAVHSTARKGSLDESCTIIFLIMHKISMIFFYINYVIYRYNDRNNIIHGILSIYIFA